jgi:hypothetical protein
MVNAISTCRGVVQAEINGLSKMCEAKLLILHLKELRLRSFEYRLFLAEPYNLDLSQSLRIT